MSGAMSWGELAPQFTWRPSQAHLLDLAGHVHDGRWHLCAPPGAGKTLIGLELARQVDRPTLVLSPTTAIRDQWRESSRLFGADPAAFTSSDPGAEVPLRCVTYQLLGNPGQAADELRAAARRLWVAEVGVDIGPEAAEARVVATEQGDRARAGREIGRHVRALRRSLGTGEDIGVPRAQLLGTRSTALVDRLAAGGLGCLVLDECHHLLDWWALVVGALVDRLATAPGGVAVIGLTATLPEPDSSREAANYAGLLGEVDAELHLAAMVAEGAVAPWRDGVRLTAPTTEEAAFLDNWSGRFVADLDEQLVTEPFVAWAVAQVSSAALDERAAAAKVEAGDSEPPASDPRAWSTFWDRDPLAAAALGRWWTARGMALPAGFEPPPEAAGLLGLVDRLTLLDAWLHDPDGGANAAERDAIDALGTRYGVAFTTRGIRWGRSVGDLVCARSSAKGDAAASILVEEAARRGASFRALVVVERDQATTPPAEARAVLGEDSGTAARILARLCAQPEVADIGVMAVTGRGAWCDAGNAETICTAVNVDARVTGDGSRWVQAEGCDIRGAVAVKGVGPGWTTAHWLAAAEVALDAHAAGVLVATRGLVGEGWDHPPLNVLVDLSEVATAGAVTQLRGRALRIDAADPQKLASLWDVAVVHPATSGDWDRFRRRHAHWWGPDARGEVMTGAAKVHPRAALAQAPTPADAVRINQQSAAAVTDEVATRAAWAAVDPGGVGTSAVRVRTTTRRRRVRTRPRRWRSLAGAATASATVGAVASVLALSVPALWPVGALGLAGAAAAIPLTRGRRRGEGETLEVLGDAVLSGLVAVGRQDLVGGQVTVEPDPAGGFVATVIGVQDDAAAVWADALAEALGPVDRPRWLLAAPGGTWRVPSVIGATKVAAEAFGARFRSRVPGTELVRAGTPRATELVLAAARERPDDLDRSLRWR